MIISEHRKIQNNIYEMKIKGLKMQKPGQFINIKINDSFDPFLRRPFSIADFNDEEGTIIYKVVGKGTNLLSLKKIGEEIDVLAPLGNGFEIDDTLNNLLLIGGGMGVAPLLGLARRYNELNKKIKIVLGFGNISDVILVEEFKKYGEVIIYTIDGSYGKQGNVLDGLKNERFDKYFACGPINMLKAIINKYPDHGYISLEEKMGCGIGVCMACSCKNKSKLYKRICVEGPVFISSEVVFDE